MKSSGNGDAVSRLSDFSQANSLPKLRNDCLEFNFLRPTRSCSICTLYSASEIFPRTRATEFSARRIPGTLYRARTFTLRAMHASEQILPCYLFLFLLGVLIRTQEVE